MIKSQSEEQKQQDENLKRRMLRIKNKILVMSGKGGVGKTTVSVNLSLGLAAAGYKVGILDTDLHGPNIAKMLGVEEKKIFSTDNGLEPVKVRENLYAISLALSGYEADTPVIWRGPLKMGAIKQFLADVNWGELDYLIIDSPPGTGDEPLSVCQLIPELKGSIIVTTPQSVAVLDSRKSINFSKKLNIPILGVIENMSGFSCPDCGKEIFLFGKGGGEKAAAEMDVAFLGAIPIDPSIVEAGDSGTHYVLENESDAVKAMKEIIKKVEK